MRLLEEHNAGMGQYILSTAQGSWNERGVSTSNNQRNCTAPRGSQGIPNQEADNILRFHRGGITLQQCVQDEEVGDRCRRRALEVGHGH
jgi:hypothetical protein